MSRSRRSRGEAAEREEARAAAAGEWLNEVRLHAIGITRSLSSLTSLVESSGLLVVRGHVNLNLSANPGLTEQAEQFLPEGARFDGD